MDWLVAGNCPAPTRFDWAVGFGLGGYAVALVIVLIALAPPYHPDIPKALNDRHRRLIQWGLFMAELLVIAFLWGLGMFDAGFAHFVDCTSRVLSLGACAVLAPVMLLIMLTAARVVGRMSAR
jgi:hypothetical protein